MEFAGIITEYDPFHNGHAAQIAAAKSAGAGCVAVCMSSGADQRGGVPVLPESVRGVRGAGCRGRFSHYIARALRLCHSRAVCLRRGAAAGRAGVRYALVFEPRTLTPPSSRRVAELLARPELDALLRERLSTGMTYAAARAEAADALLPGAGTLLRTPNNILGIEYCKAILAQGAALTPLALPRLGAAHGGGRPGEHNGIPMASASYLRSLTVEDWEPYVPPRAAALYTRAAAAGLLADGSKFEVAVLALLRAKPEADFAAVRGVSEGLEHRLAAAVREATSLDDLYTRLKTKRYPHARLRRLVLDAALGIPAELPAPPYIQVLGARKTALSRLKQAALPAGTSLADLARSGAEAAKISELHNKAVDFSALCRVETQPMGLAFTTKPVVV